MSAVIQVPDLASQIMEDHGEPPLSPVEHARVWGHAALPRTELFYGSYKTHKFAEHFHSVPAVGVVDSGTMRSFCRRANHDAPAGTVLLLNPGDVHAPAPAGQHGWSFRVFFFDPTRFSEISSDIARTGYRFSNPFVQDPLLAQSLLRLHRSLEHAQDTLAADSMILDVFERLALHHVPVSSTSPEAASCASVKRAREYLDAFYASDVSLSELASVAERSRYHLLRSFKDLVGLTPHAYLVQVRVEAAKRLLKAGRRIADVAAETGFTDQSHLTRHFKRIMGVTPNRYATHLA